MLSIMGLVPSPQGQVVSGEVWYQGQDLLKLDRNQMRLIRGREIAMIFQDPMTSLNPVMKIGKHLTEPLEMNMGLTGSQSRKRAVELLEMVGIPDAVNRLNDYPHHFSGGMRQRVMIALGLSCNPRLLIADEPTTALDVTIQAQIIDLVKRLRDEMGMSVIWITHDLGIVAGLVDRVIVMYASNIVETALVDNLYENPHHPYTHGLLNAVPRLDANGRARLIPIPGKPPDLANPPNGCSFAMRCSYREEHCMADRPQLIQIGENHHSACWASIEERNTRVKQGSHGS
jgi:oligopeptide transport system ATP-binding protein